jgi:uncharacterized protein (TIGR02145 family)
MKKIFKISATLFGVMVLLILFLIGVYKTSKIYQGADLSGGSTGSSSCPKEVTDIDKNKYNTVFIGRQCWMSENLKVKHYKDNSEIINIKINNFKKYGVLYSYNDIAKEDPCPRDWGVATDEDFIELERYAGMNELVSLDTGWRGSNNESSMFKKYQTGFFLTEDERAQINK